MSPDTQCLTPSLHEEAQPGSITHTLVLFHSWLKHKQDFTRLPHGTQALALALALALAAFSNTM